MNAIFDHWSGWSEVWLGLVLERSIVGTIVLVVAGAAWLSARRFLSSHVGSALFLVCLVPWVAPVERWLPGVSGWVPSVAQSVHGLLSDPDVVSNCVEQGDRLDPGGETLVSSKPVQPASAPEQNADPNVSTLASSARSEQRSDEASDATAAVERSASLTPGRLTVFEEPTGGGDELAERRDASPAIDSELAAPVTDDRTQRGLGLRIPVILFSLWLAIVVPLGLLFAVNLRRSYRKVRGATVLRDHPLADRMPRLCAVAGLRRTVPVLCCKDIASPAAFGLVRPVVLVPEHALVELSEEQLRWVILHELAHIRRGDLWIRLFQQLVQIAYFFHPAVWCSNAAIDRHRECACDDAALARCRPATREECARAFLHLVERAQPAPSRAVGLVPLLDHRSFVRRRLMRLADPHRRVLRGMSASSYAFLVSITLAGWSLAQTPPIEPASSTGGGAEVVGDARLEQGIVPGSPFLDPSGPPKTSDPVLSSKELGPFQETDPIQEAVERSVDWIRRNQEEDGSWSWNGRPGSAAPKPRTTGPKAVIVVDPFDPTSETAMIPKGRRRAQPKPPVNGLVERVGATGLAVLGLLESDRAVTDAALEKSWKRGVAFLLDQQDASDGCLCPKAGHHFIYSHLMGSQALLKSLRRDDDPKVRDAAQKALDFLARARNPYRGWRYDYPPAGDNDTVITGIAVLTLTSGQRLGLKIDRSALEGGASYIDEMTDPATGRTGYHERGSLAARNADEIDLFAPEHSEAPTALGLSVHLALGGDPEGPEIQKGVQLLANCVPQWSDDGSTVDQFYWFFGTSAMRSVGGATLQRWRNAVHTSLLPSQDRSGSASDGAWPAVGVWTSEGGAMFSTVFSMMTLRSAR